MATQMVRRHYLRRTGGVALILTSSPISVGAAAMPFEDLHQGNDMVGFKQHATNPGWKSTLEALGPPVDDSDLSEMRGKFVGPEFDLVLWYYHAHELAGSKRRNHPGPP